MQRLGGNPHDGRLGQAWPASIGSTSRWERSSSRLPAPGGEIPFQFDCREAAEFGRWHTWATVYDAPAGRVASYVDGRLLQQWKWAGGPDLLIGEATIGNWKPLAAFDPRPLVGSIDEVAIFTAALSDAEIRQLQESGSETQQK